MAAAPLAFNFRVMAGFLARAAADAAAEAAAAVIFCFPAKADFIEILIGFLVEATSSIKAGFY